MKDARRRLAARAAPVAAIALLTVAALGALAATPARATDFTVQSGGKSNRVVFVSKAPVESFEGKTNRIEGTISIDPSAVGDSFHVHLEVDMASLDTGIAKRNGHMRDNHLETKKYPKSVFDGVTVLGPKSGSLASGKPTAFRIEGTFTLHGLSRRIRIDALATYTPPAGVAPASIAFQTEFPVSLAEYSISRPQFLFLRLADVQQVRVSGVAVASGTPVPAATTPPATKP